MGSHRRNRQAPKAYDEKVVEACVSLTEKGFRFDEEEPAVGSHELTSTSIAITTPF
jgi:hypothetical protein